MNMIMIDEDSLIDLVARVIEHFNSRQQQSNRKWLTPKETEKLLNIKRVSLYKLRVSGKIRYSQPQKHVILYDAESIESYLEENAKETF
ncbi:MAG: helix-turn-helix domain-containing protein [Sediminibacterium sp.]